MKNEINVVPRTETQRHLPRNFLLASVTLFVICLALPAYTIGSGGNGFSARGYVSLLTGWIAPLVLVWEWFANPALFISWLKLRKQKFAAGTAFAVLALIVASSFMFRQTLVVDEGGSPRDIASKDIGYWLWLISIGVALVGNLVCLIRYRTRPA